MQWFGKSWGAPVNEDTPHVPTPTGQPCLDCGDPIEEGDQGFMIPFYRGSGEVTNEAHHRLCFARQVIPPEVMEIKGFNAEEN